MIRFNFHSPTDEPIPIDPTHLQTHESGQKSFPGGLRIATSRFATSFSSWRRTSARVSNVPVFPAQKHLACQPTIERTTVVIIEVTRRVSRRSAPRTSPTSLSLSLWLAPRDNEQWDEQIRIAERLGEDPRKMEFEAFAMQPQKREERKKLFTKRHREPSRKRRVGYRRWEEDGRGGGKE